MLPPINTFAVALGAGAGIPPVAGRYTHDVLSALAKNLEAVAFNGDSGMLFVATSGDPARWSLCLESTTPYWLPDLAADADHCGLLICGLGCACSYGICVVEPPARQPAGDLHLLDVTWSCDPAGIASLLDWLEGTLAAGAEERVALSQARREFPLVAAAPERLLRLIANLLATSVGSHSAREQTIAELQQRLRWREDQVRMVVHDMRAPLHTLSISVRTLLKSKLVPESQRDLLEVAHDTTQTLLDLTETMLQVSQLEAGLWQFKIQRLDVADLIHTVCTPLIKAQRPGQAALQVHIVDGLPAVTGDRRLLERVLTNLVSNAIKYTPVDGIITVSARAGSDGQQIEIEVRDTGQGIAPEALPHIFERFYQARSGDRSHGIGFGLYFSQLAVQAHGGAIRVDSAPGAGSSFVVTLPGAS